MNFKANDEINFYFPEKKLGTLKIVVHSSRTFGLAVVCIKFKCTSAPGRRSVSSLELDSGHGKGAGSAATNGIQLISILMSACAHLNRYATAAELTCLHVTYSHDARPSASAGAPQR